MRNTDLRPRRPPRAPWLSEERSRGVGPASTAAPATSARKAQQALSGRLPRCGAVPRSLLATGAVAAGVALVVAAALALAGALDENGSPPPPGAAAQGGADSGRVVDRVRQGLALVTAARGASGSGFMIDSAGFILTARHLVAHAGSIAVRAEGADGPIRAELVGS